MAGMRLYPGMRKMKTSPFLPPAWIGEQIFTVAPNLAKGIVVNFIEKAETVRSDLREIAPGVILLGARQWEMTCSEIQAKMIDSPFWKRFLYNLFLPVGYKIAQGQEERKKVSLALAFPLFLWVLDRVQTSAGQNRHDEDPNPDHGRSGSESG